MLRQKLFRLAAASWITAISILPAAAEQVAWQSDLEEAMTAARETNRPVLLHFWTPDCVPCRRLEKSVLNQPRVVETLERQFIPVKVNAQDHPEIARRYRVSSVPVDVVVTANNEELARMFTPQDPDRYVAQLSAIAISDGDTEVAEAAIQPRRRTARPSEIEVAATPTEEDTGKQPREADSVVASRADEEEVTERTTEKPVVVASTRNGRTKDTSAADEPEPREVINRFARQNHESDTDDAEPTAPARKQNWGRWPQGAQHESREVADSNGEEPASSDADVAEATDERTEARPARSAKSADHVAKSPASSKSQTMGLDGYCPVTLVQKQAWKKGDARFGVVHRGRTYLFAGQEEKDTFYANPDDFSPALSGIDPVEFAESGEVLDGQREHGVVYQNRVYLFATEANLDTFWQEPERYASRIQQAMQTGDFNQLRR